jgi:hypothetical protein
LRELPGPETSRIVLVVAEAVGDLAFERRRQQLLGQLLQNPAFTSQLQPTGLRVAHQLRHELLVQAVHPGLGLRVLSVLHAGHHVGHQVHFHDRELHRTFHGPPVRRRSEAPDGQPLEFGADSKDAGSTDMTTAG